jgi:dTDP-glucose 4,6-dehydratase
MSTDEVYGEVKVGEPECTETSLLKPTNPYSATKASAELLASSYYHSFKLPVVVIRCNNVFGPRQYPEKVIPAFINNLLNCDKCYIHGKGETERHFIYVDNVIDAILKIYEDGKINEIYNIANTECYKVLDLAKLLVQKLKETDDFEQYIEYIPDRNFNDFRYLINSEKLEKLGWKPKIDFEEGLKRTIQSFKKKIKKL